MITKKWVEGALERERMNVDRLDKIIGFKYKPNPGMIIETYSNTAYYAHEPKAEPEISIVEKIGALCKYLGIEIVKESKAETVVAKKIKRVKK